MNAYGRLLVGTLATGLVWLRPALGQDTAVTASSLARVLAEVAQDIRTGRPVYLVATLKFPQYVIGEFETREQAQRLAADSGAGYGVFGPYVTPADRVYAGQATIDSVVVFSRTPRGPQRATVDPRHVDALFLTPAAIDKFMIPFYSNLYGPAVATQLRADLARVMAGGCHKYTRPCVPLPGFPTVRLSSGPGTER